MTAAYLNDYSVLCAAGADRAALRTALFAAEAVGVTVEDELLPGRALAVGRVRAPLVALDALPIGQRSRNNALLLTALEPLRPALAAARERYGPARIGVVLGSSTSGIGEAERAFAAKHAGGVLAADFRLEQQELGAPAACLAAAIGSRGPAYTVSTACSSGAKALASAARLLAAGICDAVVAGGVDSLCRFTVAGFAALEAVSPERCNPLSANRRGINIGEGAALFLVSREEGPVRLSGWGESVDAHHMSAPDPSGAGALRAMRAALARAGLDAAAIDYVNLHGTATLHNDAMEARAIAALFGAATPVSSTKPLTGHALGAAGAIEAAIAALVLTDNPAGRLPRQWWDGVADPALPPLSVVDAGHALGRAPRHVLSNSFAFGGSNVALVLSAP